MFALGLVPMVMLSAYVHKRRATEGSQVRCAFRSTAPQAATIRIPYQDGFELEPVLADIESYVTVTAYIDDTAREEWIMRCEFAEEEDFELLMRDDGYRFEREAV